MTESIRKYLRRYPYMFDRLKRIYRMMRSSSSDAVYHYLDSFSKIQQETVSFIQIGANDGLRNDPIREFVIRDHWKGLLIEPLPTVFEMLQKNYKYLDHHDIHFINAAITTDPHGETIPFWSFDPTFLQSLDLENRLALLRKASFDRHHVERVVKQFGHSADVIVSLPVRTISFMEVMREHWHWGNLDLLVIDAEGHEFEIIRSIELNIVRPSSILFESHNLGEMKPVIHDYLIDNCYEVRELGGDSIAVSSE